MQINWSKIQTVLLDMDGTLLDLHYDNYFWQEYMPRAYARENQLSDARTAEILAPIFEEHAGTLNWYCVNFWSDILELDIMSLKREVAHKIAYRPQAREFLERCKVETDDVRLITNGHREVLDLKIEYTQIDKYFDELHCSHELDYPKEQRAFWERLQMLGEFDPNRTLFVDDSEAVLDSANDYGIKHIYSIAKPDSVMERMSPSKFSMLESFI